MDPLDELLKNVNHARRVPLPEGFEDAVLDKWFNKQAEKKKDYSVWMFAVAACLAACTCINILSLNAFKENSATTADSSISTVSLEDEFAEAYGLEDNMSYYSLNE